MFLESIKEFFAGKEMVGFITRLLIAIVFLFIGIKIVKIIAKRIVKSKAMMRLNKTIRTFLGHIISVLLYLLISIITIMI